MTAANALAIIGLSALLAAPAIGLAQSAGRTLRIAILDYGTEKNRAASWQAFRTRLRELGYADGKLAIDVRYARGEAARLPVLAADLVALKPDIIVVAGSPATRAATQATKSIPIVFTGIADPVASGFVASLARPGANATGVSNISSEVGTKWLELLRELAPAAKRIAYLGDTSNEGSMLVFKRMQEQARKIDATVEMFGGQDAKQLDQSFEAIVRHRFNGLIVANQAVMLEHRKQIVQFAARQKLPAVYGRRDYSDVGGLLSYGADWTMQYQRAADYVHRIAQGTKPADLPVERPSTVRMVLNLKTSRVLGIPIPDSIRHRDDELID